MTTRNNIQKFCILYGPKGSNGKSLTLKVLELIVGEENVSHKDMKLLASDFEVKGIKNMQVNISYELPVDKIKDTATLKATTTGDAIETRFKLNPETVLIKSYVKHIFATNYLPEVNDKTDGFYRRVHIIPFENVFDPSDPSFNEDEFLTQENLEYLAARAIDAYMRMVASGKNVFANEEESKELVKQFQHENDSVKAFIEQDLFPTDVLVMRPRTEFNELYESFCKDNLLKSVSKIQLYKELIAKYNFDIKIINGDYYLYRDPDTNSKGEKSETISQ